ncbi:helix-turn-helix domain-containing protein [Acidiferrobacter sp.]|uniref:helix-turn-helix domain-containing protein n=1 Tax=Acidiferrobacter sp. TaxID=1872107 RepID=UPI00261B4BF2|nr:helix-turn-helix domain-containing protein [Acidiferrobacter sp.]
MHYPVMTERQVATRWRISLKTLRRWRASGEGPRWHKLFKLVRYHMDDLFEFERRGTQYWSTILDDGERVPKVVARPPKEAPPPEDATAESFYLTAKKVLEATGLPGYWFTDPKARAAKRIPHLALVGNVRYSLEAIWAWEQASSVVGRPQEPKAAPTPELIEVAPQCVPRWYELARAMDGERFDSPQTSE